MMISDQPCYGAANLITGFPDQFPPPGTNSTTLRCIRGSVVLMQFRRTDGHGNGTGADKGQTQYNFPMRLR